MTGPDEVLVGIIVQAREYRRQRGWDADHPVSFTPTAEARAVLDADDRLVAALERANVYVAAGVAAV